MSCMKESLREVLLPLHNGAGRVRNGLEYLIKGDVLGRKQRGLEGLLARRVGEGRHEPRAEQQVGLPDPRDIQVRVRRQHLRNTARPKHISTSINRKVVLWHRSHSGEA